MASTLIKIVGSVAFLGTVTTSSYFIKGYYNTERITHRISDQGMTLLTSKDSDKEWSKRWKEYVENKQSNIWNLKDFDQFKADKSRAPQSFKNKCLSDAYLAIEENWNSMKQIEKFCTKSFAIKELLKKDGFELLEKGKDDEAWKAAYKNYFDSNKNNSNPFRIDGWERIRSKFENKLPDGYQDKCLAASKPEVKSNREGNYLKVKDYCAKKI